MRYAVIGRATLSVIGYTTDPSETWKEEPDAYLVKITGEEWADEIQAPALAGRTVYQYLDWTVGKVWPMGVFEPAVIGRARR